MTRMYVLHGLMGTATTHFAPQLSALADEFTFIPIDLPGHGMTTEPATEDYLSQATRAIRERMAQEGPGWILGLSLGATLAMKLALEPPDELEGVIVTGYSPFIPEAMEPLMHEQRDYFLNIDQHAPDIALQFEKLHGPTWKTTARAVLDLMTFRFPTMTETMLQSITLPVVILNGTNEDYEVDATAFVAAHVPNVIVLPVEGAGHTANLDQPERFNALLLQAHQSMLTT
ncbi:MULTISPECIES: alpha/beta fold hydrolase [Exiguobacterium]|uniref:alpha/beta fold hydrolase n=1 Tax=Exiguobacterium TaxID=33986 RepID=UPI00068CA148|nr:MULTISPECIES: alpha/beta fold hydrolase [Exiguobacterium]HCD58403.1 alpha/beta hydrolase [Exiguobacterium sp.]